MINIKSQILHKISNMDDNQKLEFLSNISQWCQRQAQINFERLNTPNVEFILENTDEIS